MCDNHTNINDKSFTYEKECAMDSTLPCKFSMLTIKSCAENDEFECMPEDLIKDIV